MSSLLISGIRGTRGLRLLFPLSVDVLFVLALVFQQKCPKAFSHFSKRESGALASAAAEQSGSSPRTVHGVKPISNVSDPYGIKPPQNQEKNSF